MDLRSGPSVTDGRGRPRQGGLSTKHFASLSHHSSDAFGAPQKGQVLLRLEVAVVSQGCFWQFPFHNTGHF